MRRGPCAALVVAALFASPGESLAQREPSVPEGSVPGAAAESNADCRSSPLVRGACFWVDGELRSHEGWPPNVRIEVAGGLRELGVGPGEIGILPRELAERLPARISGRFEVCPFGETVRLPYHRAEDSGIEMVCVAETAEVQVKRWDLEAHAERSESLAASGREPSSDETAAAPSPGPAVENTRAPSMEEEKILLDSRAIDAGAVRGRQLGLALRERGTLASSLGRLEPALADLERAAAIVPELSLVDLGIVLTKQRSFERAIEVLGEAAERAPSFGKPLRQRGWARYLAGDYAGARADFKAHLAREPADRYAWLWLYLAAEQGAGEGWAELSRWSRGQDLSQWPGPLVSLFLGRLGPDEVLARMPRVVSERLDRRTSCEAFFFLGEHALLARDAPRARELFERVRSTGIRSFVEYASAELELARIP